jgi:outer membrane protein assembly factor BamD (BamD/ComL family)
MKKRMNYKNLRISLLLFILIGFLPIQAAYVFKNGSFTHVDRFSNLSFEEISQNFGKALEEKELGKASAAFALLSNNYGNRAFEVLKLQSSAYFFWGVSHYLNEEPELALKSFAKYFQGFDREALEFFKEGMGYKFAIAEGYRKGQKRRPFANKQFPRMLNGHTEAIELYDQILASLPNDELAAKALFSRGLILSQVELYSDSIDSFKTLIHSFPHTPLSILAFQEISKVYLEMSAQNAQNPYLLDLARLNIRRFEQYYPNDQESLQLLQNMAVSMEENFAAKLKSTAEFYERKKMPKAAVIYYHSSLANYPNTISAKACKERLIKLNDFYQELGLPHELLQN